MPDKSTACMQLVSDLLNPEMFGYACSRGVRDAARRALGIIDPGSTLECESIDPNKLDKPARVGGVTFGVGVSKHHVVEAAQRLHEMEAGTQPQSPEQRQEAERNRRKLWDQIHGPVDAVQADARDAAFEAVRKKFCKLQRYSFFLDEKGNVRRVPQFTGNWVEFESVHTLFEPASVDAAIAAVKGVTA